MMVEFKVTRAIGDEIYDSSERHGRHGRGTRRMSPPRARHYKGRQVCLPHRPLTPALSPDYRGEGDRAQPARPWHTNNLRPVKLAALVA